MRGVILMCLLASCAQTHSANQEDQAARQPNSRVEALFQSMREGNYHAVDFPELTWNDIPCLLSLAENKRSLRHFCFRVHASANHRIHG